MRSLFLIGLCASVAGALAQPQVVMNWARTDIPAGMEEFVYHRVVAHPSGNFVVAGWSKPHGQARRGIIRMIRLDGSVWWTREFVNTDPVVGGDVKVDQVRLLVNGDIQSTMIGSVCGSSVTTWHNGANVVTTQILENSFTSSFSPEGHAFFAGNRVVFTDASAAGNTNLEWRHWLKFHKISNTMFATSYAEQDMGLAYERRSGSSSMVNAKFAPVVFFVFSPEGTFGLATVGESGSDSSGAYWGGHRYFATRFNAGFGEIWRNTYDFNRYSQFHERLSSPSYQGEHSGISLGGILRFNVQYYRQAPNESGPTYFSESVRFHTETGETLLSLADRSVFHNTINQNGFTYRYRHTPSLTVDQWGKAPLNGGSFNWVIGDQALHRLHFQLMGAARTAAQDLPVLRITRFRDSDGTVMDETDFQNTMPRKVRGVTQQSNSGISMVVGERQFDDGRLGAWIARLGQAPVANNNSYTTRRNTALNASSILGNDRFVAGLSPHIVTQPRNGLLYMNLDGTFRYVPRANYVGSDIFTYRVQRPGLAATAPASVFIQITQ